MGDTPPPNPNLLRDRLANERTFLAWLRTGIAITSLGFVVARFDLFLREIARAAAGPAAESAVVAQSQTTFPIGLLLVLAGPGMVILALIGFLRTERALTRGYGDSRPIVGFVVTGVTGCALLAGLGLAAHLLANWPR